MGSYTVKINAEHLKKVAPALVAVLFLAAIIIFWNEFRDMEMSELKDAFAEIPRPYLLLSFASVACGYWLATIIEKHAVAESGLAMSYPRVARVSFISRAVGAAAGVLISGASFRYRYYSRTGASPMQIGRIVAETQILTWAGAAALNGLVLLLWPEDITELIGFPAWLRYLLASGCVVFPFVLVLVSLVVKNGKNLTVYGRIVPVPKPRTMSRQLLAGFFIPPSAALAIYFLLPTSHGVHFLVFCGVFALSAMVSAVSMVPAGVGVFDASLIWMLRSFYNGSELLSALLLYRLFNNLAPFAAAAVLVVFDSFRPRHVGKN